MSREVQGTGARRTHAGSPRQSATPIRVGISACLLGQEVRYDGGHKRDRYLTDTLGRVFEWVPVCPEVEMGLGTPRETLRLAGDPDAPRLVFCQTGGDITEGMKAWARSRLEALARLGLSGCILKSDSPSCGVERVRVDRPSGIARRDGIGIYARAVLERFPLLPVEEEGRLHDLPSRENFVERVLCYRRWRDLVAGGLTRGKLVAFHTAHTLLMLAHSPKHYTELDRLVADGKRMAPRRLEVRYGGLFMAGLRLKATAKKHSNVMRHIVGYFKRDLDARDKDELLGVIGDYRRGLLPLVVPLTLLRHHISGIHVPYLQEQIYLAPHPKELMLRNHVRARVSGRRLAPVGTP